jgi:formate/nitrite transporter FocA (FNT family)
MIPAWATAVLIGLGFGLYALTGALLRWQPPSARRLERVVTFGLMGTVLIILGTAQLVSVAIGPTDRDFAERVVVVTTLACVPLCVAGRPIVRWWVARRPGPELDFTEDRGGHAVQVPPKRSG